MQGINESARISAKFFGGHVPIVPYSWYRYHDGGPKSLELISAYDAGLEFVRPFHTASLNGAHMPYIIIWGHETTALQYEQAVMWIRSHMLICAIGVMVCDWHRDL